MIIRLSVFSNNSELLPHVLVWMDELESGTIRGLYYYTLNFSYLNCYHTSCLFAWQWDFDLFYGS